MPSAAGSDVNAAEMGRFAQCDASADRRTPLGARGDPARVSECTNETSPGAFDDQSQ